MFADHFFSFRFTGYKREDVNVVEWHCTFSKVVHIVDVYINHALQSHILSHVSRPLVIDLGCGLSSMGVELIRSGRWADIELLLVDISPELVERLRQLYVMDPSIRCMEGDCRNMKHLSDCSANILIDKGTLDALCGEEDKILMLRV